MYQQYSTAIKVYYALEAEKVFVNKNIRQIVPYSTAAYWRNKFKTANIIGIELENNFKKNCKDIHAMYHPANRIPQILFAAYARFVVMLIEMVGVKKFKSSLRNSKKNVIRFMDDCAGFLTRNDLAGWFGISAATLANWKHEVAFPCSSSPLFLCVRRHLNQATKQEVEVIKQFLTDKQYAHWGIKSTWALAFKQKLTALAPGSWYRYNRRFRFKTRLAKGKKPKYTSVIAQCVNEIWHADITQIKTKDGTRWYLYTIMDNFSRFHHVWQLEKVVSAQIRTETIKSAIQKVFPTNPDQNLRLITDGGPENDNITVRQFLDHCAVSVNHQIALKDIEQSNSMMERFYHTAKYSYLYRQDLTDENIHQKVEEMYHEYHYAKPHYALGIHTPFEVLNGADKHACFAEIYIQATQKRRQANRNTKCEQEC